MYPEQKSKTQQKDERYSVSSEEKGEPITCEKTCLFVNILNQESS